MSIDKNLEVFYSDDYKWSFESISVYTTQFNDNISVTIWFSNKRYFQYVLGEKKYVDRAELNIEEYEFMLTEVESRTTLSVEQLRELIIYER